MIRKCALAAIAAATILSPLHASAAPLGGLARSFQGSRPATFLSLKGPTLAPFSHIRFCVQNPDDCRQDADTSAIPLSREKRAELQRVNQSINRTIRPVNDKNGTLDDVWEADVAAGDCEDFVLTKRRKLIAEGWPSGALRIAVARTSSGEGHAVLVVKTGDGDLVLDNRTNSIRPWNRAGLRWIKIQSGENPRLWFNL